MSQFLLLMTGVALLLLIYLVASPVLLTWTLIQ